MKLGLQAPLDKVTMQLLGERGFPLAEVKLTAQVVSDFNDLMVAVQHAHPTATAQDVVRAIWRHGTKAFRHSVTTNRLRAFDHVPMPPAEPLPGPSTTPVKR